MASKEAVKVGLIGTGWAVKVQVPQFKDAGLRIAAISSRSQQKADGLCKQHGIDRGYTDVKKLAESDVDIVSVVSPAYMHAEHALIALEAGKAVICDKPFVLNAGEARKLLQASRKRQGQLAMIDHEVRFTPASQAARDHIRKGSIGAIKAVYVTACLPAPGDRPYSWWNDRKLGGGVWGAVGSHLIDQLRFILDAEVQAISAKMDVVNQQLPDPEKGDKLQQVTADDLVTANMRLVPRPDAASQPAWKGAPQPLVASMTLGLLGSLPRPPVLTFFGEGGGMELFLGASKLTVTKDGKETDSIEGEGDAFSWGTKLMGEAISKALGPSKDQGAVSMAATWEDGAKVQLVMDAGWRSHDSNSTWVDVEQL